MASRRLLKKAIKSASIEMVNECYMLSAFIPEVGKEKVAELISKVIALNVEFVQRANRTDGKNDPAIVKAYFKKLSEDWSRSVGDLLSEIVKLSEKA